MPQYNSNARKNLEQQIKFFTMKLNSRKQSSDKEVLELIPLLEQFIESLKALKEVSDKQYQFAPGSSRYENLNDQSFGKLSEAYSNAGKLCEQLISGDAKHVFIDLAEPLKNIGNDLAEDTGILMQYKTSKTPVTFQMLVDANQKKELELGDHDDLGTVGHALSSRIPYKYVMPDGEEIDGVLTPAKNLDCRGVYQAELNKFNEAHPQAKKFLDNLYTSWLKNGRVAKKNGVPLEDNPENLYTFTAGLSDLLENQKAGNSELANILFATLGGDKYSGLSSEFLTFTKNEHPRSPEESRKPDPDKMQIFKDFINSAAKNTARTLGIHLNGAKIKDGSRIDSRNAAMSKVADMLGTPNLVARSVPMKVTLNGKEIEGTFMARGKGEDIEKPSDDASEYTEDTFKTNGLKSIFDLKVLDFICGNTDRHLGNMMYSFDTSNPDASKHKFTGVQGIDNDCSFGTFVPDEKNPKVMFFPSLKEMQYISQSMADSVKKLTADELKFQLRPIGLSEDQLEAAGKRLNILKEAIEEGEKFYDRPLIKDEIGTNPLNYKIGKMRILPDDKFAKIDLDKLVYEGPKQNNLKFAARFLQVAETKVISAEKKTLVTKQVNEKFGYTITDKEIKDTKLWLSHLEDVTSKIRGTSENFENLRSSVENYSKFLEQNKDTLLSPDLYAIREKYLNNIKSKSETYMKEKIDSLKAKGKVDKEGKIKPNSYEKARLEAALRVSKSAFEKYKNPGPDYYEKLLEHDADNAKIDLVNEYDQRAMDKINAKLKDEAEKINSKESSPVLI